MTWCWLMLGFWLPSHVRAVVITGLPSLQQPWIGLIGESACYTHIIEQVILTSDIRERGFTWATSMCGKWNESGFRPPLCTGPGEPPGDGEMIEMTLSSRHRIRNSSPGGLRPSTLPLGHGSSPQYWLSHVDGEETFFVSFKPPRPGTEPRTRC